jgi:hypothetical protein
MLVYRRNSRVFYRELDAVEHRAIAAAVAGASFAGMCDLIAEDAGEADPILETNRLLTRWLADGIFRKPT